MVQGFCIWFTGLSAAGKTTLAGMLRESLDQRGLRVEVLDGEVVRNSLGRGLGFSREDRETNLRRIAFVAHLLARNGVAVIVAAIGPYQGIRDEIRSMIDDYVEVYLSAPLDVCIERDPKGLYKEALSGRIENFTGISDPYETPASPDLCVPTHLETPEQSRDRILTRLEELGYLEKAEGYTDEEKERLKKRLTDLGYM